MAFSIRPAPLTPLPPPPPHPHPTPNQVHAYVGDQSGNSYVISWLSFEPLEPGMASVVEYWATTSANSTVAASTPRRASAVPSPFTDMSTCPNVTRLMHNVAIDTSGLGARVSYRVFVLHATGRAGPARTFELALLKGRYPLRTTIFGDLSQMSYDNRPDTSIPLLQQWTASGYHDLVVHGGDIGYNLEFDCGKVGDAFGADIEPVASRLPYMMTAGNHEREMPAYTYSQYENRYQGQQLAANASQSASVRFYSFDYGPLHVALFDTDAWVYAPVFPLSTLQHAWLKADLAAVNRSKTPWVVVVGHRAMYCTKTPDDECNGEAQSVRVGGFFPGIGADVGVEQLLLDNKVDFYFSGHTHHYERTWPVAAGHVAARSYAKPQGVVHIQSGIAGGAGQDNFTVPQQPWEAFRDTTVVNNNGVVGYRRGISRLVLLSDSAARFEQVDIHGNVFDSFDLTR